MSPAVTFELSKAGGEVINVQDPPSFVSAVGAMGDGSTDDHAAIQACFDYVKGQARARNHIIYFPALRSNGQTAVYEVSKPLRVWTHTRINGSGATIRSSTNFDWVNHPYWQHPLFQPAGIQQPGDVALMELWNDSTSRGGSSRIHLNWLTLDCRNQPGSIGFWGKQQQNSAIIDLRIDNVETGFVTWGQQAKMERLQVSGTGVKVGVYLGSNYSGSGVFGIMGAKFFKFEELNVEYYTVAGVRMVCDGPNWFEDSHFENLHATPTPTARVVDCQSGEFTMEKTWSTHIGDAVIVVGDKVPVPQPIQANYVIRQWRNSDIGTAVKFLDDRTRNKVRMVGHQRMVEYLSGGFQNDTQIDYDSYATWWGDEGGEVRIGGSKGGSNPPAGHTGAQFTVIPNVNQDEPMVRFTDSAKVLRAGVGQKGDLFLGAYATKPSVAGLPNGTMIVDTTLNKPLWLIGGVWRDATGTPA